MVMVSLVLRSHLGGDLSKKCRTMDRLTGLPNAESSRTQGLENMCKTPALETNGSKWLEKAKATS